MATPTTLSLAIQSVINRLAYSSAWLVAWKWCKFLTRILWTGNHEIYRICSDRSAAKFPQPWHRVHSVDRSLQISSKLAVARRQLEAADSLSIDPAFSMICRSKFPLAASMQEQANLKLCLKLIHQLHRFIYAINQRASTKYDPTITAHETRLYAMHFNLLNKHPTQRISKEWQLLGFQGSDPATDFRSMGKLALDQLFHFSKTAAGKRIWAESSGDGEFGYSWAICGIQVTSFQLQLLRSRKLHLLLYRIHFETLGNGSAAASSEEENIIKNLTAAYFDMYNWLFTRYHEIWHRFCAEKQQRHRSQLQGDKKIPFIPIMHHQEFYTLFCHDMESDLFCSRFFSDQLPIDRRLHLE